MNLLLDTHALLWWLADDPRLTAAARSAIADGSNLVSVSAASALEISIKRELKKLESPPDLVSAVISSGLTPLPISLDHAMLAGALPRHHDDPFDRMLVAQAMAERMTVVTGDPAFAHYGVPVLDA